MLSALFVAACSGQQTKTIPPGVDASIDPPSLCADACARLAQLDCREAQPSKTGLSCVDFCEKVQSSGKQAFSLSCVANAESATVLRETCGVRCPPAADAGPS